MAYNMYFIEHNCQLLKQKMSHLVTRSRKVTRKINPGEIMCELTSGDMAIAGSIFTFIYSFRVCLSVLRVMATPNASVERRRMSASMLSQRRRRWPNIEAELRENLAPPAHYLFIIYTANYSGNCQSMELVMSSDSLMGAKKQIPATSVDIPLIYYAQRDGPWFIFRSLCFTSSEKKRKHILNLVNYVLSSRFRSSKVRPK